SANVINQVIGKENAKINITLDYQNKIAGSVVENPHKAAAGFSSVIPTPAQVTGEVSQNAYNALSALDGDVTSPYTATNKDMTYFLVQWNVLEALERELGSKFFIDRGATTTKEKVEIARTILTVINPAFWGYGKSPSGNKLNFQIWINNSSWAGTRSHNASTVTKMEYNSTGASTNNYISDDGYLYASAYAEPSDGTVASTVVGDCAQLNLEIEISANDHIESTIATY
ncbi:phage baseplate upper protein, partial [Enterococcus raffinosus]|nr:phage baseplate upper protein [Enterococcus raffinosus]